MNESIKPNLEFTVTPEGAEAAFLELRERTEKREDLLFIQNLKEQYPQIKVYLVGGIVRDAAMGLPSSDYDFVISGIGQKDLESYIQNAGQIVATTDRQTAVYKFVPKESKEVYDLALPRRETYNQDEGRKPCVETGGISIEDDLSRRDLTINAMALPVFNSGENVIDPYGGLDDIRQHKIQTVGNAPERFVEDPLRMLRVIRFACRFGFDIEENTLKTIAEMKEKVGSSYVDKTGSGKLVVSNERIAKEISGSIKANPELFLELYDQTGLLEIIFPEVEDLRGVDQPPEFHLEGDALVHTKMVLANLPNDASEELCLAALFHDIGKKSVFQSVAETGDRIRFNDHDDKSAELSEEILKRFCFSNEVKEKVIFLVKNHMVVMHSFCKMKLSKQKRLVKMSGFDDLVKLVVADLSASIRPDGTIDLEHIQKLLKKVQFVQEKIDQEEENQTPAEIINGSKIIELATQIKPDFDPKGDGPIIGRVKNKVNDSYQNEEIATTEEAVELAKKILNDWVEKLV